LWLDGDEADRFRMRAKECRDLAKAARDDAARQELLTIAGELEAEADKIDTEEDDSEPPNCNAADDAMN
jgi:hypothetical protein